MEDGFRARIDMGTTIRQRRNLLSPFNELAWASHGSRSANGQGIEDRLVLVSSQVLEAFLKPCPRDMIDLQFLTLRTAASNTVDRPLLPFVSSR